MGSLKEGVHIKNGQLLQLNHAPICWNCDAYHCKRCVFLNKKTTLEINSPSRQQCVISHLERNTSMHLLEELRPGLELFREFNPIPEIPYLDPYEMLDTHSNSPIDTQGRERLIAGLLSKPLEKLSTTELLYQVFLLDSDLLIRLKNLNHGEYNE